MFSAGMFGAVKPGFRSLASLKLVVNVVGELQTEKNSCGIARFPCDSTAFFAQSHGMLQQRTVAVAYHGTEKKVPMEQITRSPAVARMADRTAL